VMDFTKPVNPAMEGVIEAAIGNGLTAADAIDLYAGSGGGTGIDLQASGFAWIQYVRFEGIDPDAYGGEIDAVAAVRPMNLGDALSIAPSNLTNGTATLFFQSPDDQNRTALSVKFNSLSDMALVTTASSDNLTAFAPLPGVALNAALLELSPILGSDPVTFNVDLALSAGQNYSGNGSDLLLCQASGTNWILQPFTFIAENHGLVTQGVTNFSGFAVVQMAAPLIQAQMNTNGFNVTFSSIAGLAYTLECSTNLVSWTPLARFTATNSEPICLRDNSAPADKAFYRLVVARP
ncbi:MAG TPA: hypothetical protein VK327_06960, partial [Candidatus Paceibacterota bacterium]|nr:hypothetical protein [Candidatus Paceibacterota bacterium]